MTTEMPEYKIDAITDYKNAREQLHAWRTQLRRTLAEIDAVLGPEEQPKPTRAPRSAKAKANGNGHARPSKPPPAADREPTMGEVVLDYLSGLPEGQSASSGEIAEATHLKSPKRDAQGRIVLAYGEATGHCHAIHEPDAELFELDKQDMGPDGDAVWARLQRVLRVQYPYGVSLRHEEHGTITLPPGDYIVRRQREYSPQELRIVAD